MSVGPRSAPTAAANPGWSARPTVRVSKIKPAAGLLAATGSPPTAAARSELAFGLRATRQLQVAGRPVREPPAELVGPLGGVGSWPPRRRPGCAPRARCGSPRGGGGREAGQQPRPPAREDVAPGIFGQLVAEVPLPVGHPVDRRRVPRARFRRRCGRWGRAGRPAAAGTRRASPRRASARPSPTMASVAIGPWLDSPPRNSGPAAASLVSPSSSTPRWLTRHTLSCPIDIGATLYRLDAI